MERTNGKFLCIIFAILFANKAKAQLFRQPAKLSTPTLINEAGFKFEEHKVTTADGYILTLFRIPTTAQKNQTNIGPPSVVFFMHGFQRSSIDWVLNGPEKSPAYVFANAGYDVWLGNARGTRYSREHLTKKASSGDYWNFSWHEFGVYDLPAFVDYIVMLTGAPKLHYIAHSQGVMDFMVASSTVPEFNQRIQTAHLMGGAINYDHSPTVKGLLLLEPALKLIVGLAGNFDLGSTSSLGERFINLICKDGALSQQICADRVFFITGWNSPYLNRTLLPNITITDSSGASSKQVLHFMQVARTAQFRQYDYGVRQNQQIYQSAVPPAYDLAAMTVPSYIYYCDNDSIADVKDVEKLIQQWPRYSLKGSLLLPFPGCNHIDFLFGINVTDYVYREILNAMNSYENKI